MSESCWVLHAGARTSCISPSRQAIDWIFKNVRQYRSPAHITHLLSLSNPLALCMVMRWSRWCVRQCLLLIVYLNFIILPTRSERWAGWTLTPLTPSGHSISKPSVIRAEIWWTAATQWLQTTLSRRVYRGPLHKRGTRRKSNLGFPHANTWTVSTGGIRPAGGKTEHGEDFRTPHHPPCVAARRHKMAQSRRALPFPRLTHLSCSRFRGGTLPDSWVLSMPDNVKRGRAANDITSKLAVESLATWDPAKALQGRTAAYFNTQPWDEYGLHHGHCTIWTPSFAYCSIGNFIFICPSVYICLCIHVFHGFEKITVLINQYLTHLPNQCSIFYFVVSRNRLITIQDFWRCIHVGLSLNWSKGSSILLVLLINQDLHKSNNSGYNNRICSVNWGSNPWIKSRTIEM